MESLASDKNSIWNEDSYEGKEFGKKFAVPYPIFHKLVKLVLE